MFINWFTVVAQIINFLILVWLLKRYLYKPILKAVEEREKRIASQLEDAKEKEADANKERDTFQKKNEEFDRDRNKMMDKASADAEKEKQRLLEEARNHYKDLSAKLEKALEEKKSQLKSEIKSKTQNEVFAIARKTLNDLASRDLEEQMINVFISRLKAQNDEEKNKFKDAFKEANESIVVNSSFELKQEQQSEIEAVLKDITENEPKLNFETSANILGGIELSANGYKVSWSIDEYLGSIEKQLSEIIDTKQETEEEESLKK